MADPNASPAPRLEFRSFVEKHNRLFTMIGASVVLVGFIVREHFRDEGLEISNRIRDKQTGYMLQSNFVSVLADLHYLSRALLPPDFDSALPTSEVLKRDVTKLTQRARQIDQDSGDLDARLYIAEGLLEVVPEPPAALEDEAKQLRKEVNSMQDDAERLPPFLNRVASSLRESELTKARPIDQVNPTVRDASTNLADLEKKTNALEERVSQLQGKVAKASTEALIEESEKVGRFKRLSDVLFVAGWTIGLVGKIYKLPALVEAGAE